jgi:ABC-type nitrate/sulfonate/bicarbonate transport system permease component
MIFLKTKNKKYQALLASYLLVWILLFEFLLPPNKFLPKPSIVLSALPDLWNRYNLPENILSTLAVIYFSLGAAYLAIRLLRKFIIRENNFLNTFLISIEWFSEYLPGIVIGFFLIYWFPASEFIEFIFAFAVAFTSLLIKVKNLSPSVKREYIDAAESLGADDSAIIENVSWRSLQPEIFNHLVKLHFYLWMLLLIFEFAKGGYGMGVIYSDALQYRDLSALFLISIITGAVIFIFSGLLKYIKRKFYAWET